MKKIVGIDIGSLYTKVVELEVGNKIILTGMFSFLTPYNTTVSGKMVNRNRLVKEIFQNIPLKVFKDARIGVNIPFSSPVVLTVTLPKMSRKESALAAVTEARRKMIPAPGPKSVFETIDLGEVAEEGASKLEVLIVKDEKDAIDTALALFKDAEAIPVVVAPSYVATGALIARNHELQKKEIALIDIGYTSMNISVFQGKYIVFNRNITFGCKDIVAGIVNGLAVTTEKAEEIIAEYGVPDVEFDPKNRVAIAEEIMRQKYEAGLDSEAAKQINPLELRMFLEPSLERTIQEIRRTFIYFKERHESRNIEEIFFLGGGALIKNFVAVVGKKISPFPKIIEPLKLSAVSPKEKNMTATSVFYSSAISLSLGTVLKAHEVINFLPYELKKKEELAIRRSLLGAVCALVMFGFLLGWLNLWVTANNTKKDLKRVSFELKRNEDVSQMEGELKKRLSMIEQKTSRIKELLDERVSVAPLLAECAAKKPRTVVFTDFYLGPPRTQNKEEGKEEEAFRAVEKSSYRMELTVRLKADYEEANSIMKGFVESLKDSAYIHGVQCNPPALGTIAPTVKEKEGRELEVFLTRELWREFVITAQLNG